VTRIQKTNLPSNSLLQSYVELNAYTDCYCVELEGSYIFEEFVESFYTTHLFKLERSILKWLANKPSTDQQAKQLATGDISYFAVWTVEKRSDTQILMCDFLNRTRSWLMLESFEKGGLNFNKLYFGSAVVRKQNGIKESIKNGKNGLGTSFNLLLGFHKLYSRALLKSSVKKLIRLNASDIEGSKSSTKVP